jgi:hypothetical protein
VPKHKPTKTQNWQKVSDTTGRGFGDPLNAGKPFSKGVSNYKDRMPRPTMKTITTANQPDLDLKNRFYRDNLSAMTETKVMITAKQEAEKRLVIDKYVKAAEIARVTGTIVDPKLERAYQSIIQERQSSEHRLKEAINRYNVEMERAIKHGRPMPISVEQAYIEIVDPELAQTTKQTKSKVFPVTANWPKMDSAKKRTQSEPKVTISEKPASP